MNEQSPDLVPANPQAEHPHAASQYYQTPQQQAQVQQQVAQVAAEGVSMATDAPATMPGAMPSHMPNGNPASMPVGAAVGMPGADSMPMGAAPAGAVPMQQAYAMSMGAVPAAAGAGVGDAAAEDAAPRIAIPSADDLRAELRRSSTKSRVRNVARNALFAILAVAALAVLISMLFMPVLRIFGNSMTPTLQEGSIVVAVKNAPLEQGDVVAFYYNNKVLVKRVIAGPGSWVDITEDGTVSVDGNRLDEPYVSELALGECDIELPYQVPDNRYFVMGDHRSTSVDSRSTTLGCISNDQLVGKVLANIWPLNDVGLVS